MLTLANAIASRSGGARAGHDQWGGDSLEWFALSPPEPHNFDVLPDVRSDRPMRDIRDAIANRTARAERAGPRDPAGSLSAVSGAETAVVAQRPSALRPSCATTSR